MPLPIREEFTSCMRLELQAYPVQVLIRGQIPLASMFANIRRSLQKTREVVVSRGTTVPWESLFYEVLESYEHIVTANPGEVPKTKTKPTQPAAEHNQPSRSASNKVKEGSSSTAKKDNKSMPLPGAVAVPEKPSIDEVLSELSINQEASELYRRPGQKYIKCKVVDCQFCPAMYKSMAITPCSRFGHANCNQLGWFPHVGISLWKTLRSQHDAGMPFKSRSFEVKEGEIQPLEHLLAKKAPAKRPGSPIDPVVAKSVSWYDMTEV